MGRNSALWSSQSQAWVAWARSPGHDAYWHYRDSFFERVGDPEGLTLDLGCGEGRLGRDLVARGHVVIGVDRSEDLVRAAKEVQPDALLAVADATALPFRSVALNTVVAYNVLMDVDDLPGTLEEVGRVLTSAGCLAACVLHPTATAGRFVSEEIDSDFVLTGSYFERRHITASVERDGLRISLGSYHRTIGDYAAAICRAGLTIRDILEPEPAMTDAPVASSSAKRGHRVPMFLQFVAEKAMR